MISMILIIEIVLGYGGITLNKLGMDVGFQSFLPKKTHDQFEFHPLLAAVPSPNFSLRSSTHYSYSHSKSKIRNGALPFDKNKPHIAVFGGSTTYDTRVSNDASTWVSLLDEQLTSYTVSNNGVPGYSSVEHVIQTAFYEDRAGTSPVCSLYYLGWNDIRNFGFDNLDSGYAEYHMLSQYGNLRIRYSANTLSPLINLLATYIFRNEIPFPEINSSNYENEIDIHSNDKMFEVADRNIELISAINKTRGIKTVLIAQILNRSQLLDQTSGYGWLPFVVDADVWPLQHRFNLFLEQKAQELNIGFIYPNIHEFSEVDFADNGHFNNNGTKKFANLISKDVAYLCGGFID